MDTPITVTKDVVMARLATVYDPEIPVNIVELGLVYAVDVQLPKVTVDVTMTAPACPAADQVVGDCRSRVLEIPGVTEADIRVVWDPPWTPDKMSEAAKLELGFGF